MVLYFITLSKFILLLSVLKNANLQFKIFIILTLKSTLEGIYFGKEKFKFIRTTMFAILDRYTHWTSWHPSLFHASPQTVFIEWTNGHVVSNIERWIVTLQFSQILSGWYEYEKGSLKMGTTISQDLLILFLVIFLEKEREIGNY